MQSLTSLLDEDSGSLPGNEAMERDRWIDHIDPRLVNVLTVLGFGLPGVTYFWLLGRYSVNVVVNDQWDDVTVIRATYSHFFDWGALWAQHNENRIFFPNLIVVFLTRTVHFNIQVEEFLSACMLVTATALIIWAHKRRSPLTPWLYYCPVAFLAFTLAQFENTLWGFQMAWFLVLLSLAVALCLLDRVVLGWLTFMGAVAAAVVGSFSSSQGLLIWPVGLVLLYHRRRSWLSLIIWLTAGIASFVLYTRNFNSGAAVAPHGYALQHPVQSIKFYLFAIGDVLGYRIRFGQPGEDLILLFGLIVLLLAGGTAIAYGIRRDDQSGSPIGVALIVMGLLFAGTVTEGRIVFGYFAASASRYTTFDLLVPMGIYLALLGRPTLGIEGKAAGGGWRVIRSARDSEELSTGPARWGDRIGLPIARCVIVILIAVQVAFSLPNGVKGARQNYIYQARAAVILKDINHASDAEIGYSLYLFSKPSFVRSRAAVLERHHLSLFANESPDP